MVDDKVKKKRGNYVGKQESEASKVSKYREEGQRVKWLIRQRGYTANQIANHFNYEPRTFNNYMRGKTSIPAELRRPLAELLECPVEELFPSPFPSSKNALQHQEQEIVLTHSQSFLPPSTHMIQWG